MPTVSNTNFGPLIAYLVPGATALLGFSPFSPMLRSWFAAAPATAPTLGGFLYLTVASLAVGMTVSAIRWVMIDALHHLTGVRYPALDFRTLGRNVDGFILLIEIHYRHYQFYANMVIAYAGYRVRLGGLLPLGWPDLGFLFLEAVFFAASRDTLGKYYLRSQQLFTTRERTTATVPTRPGEPLTGNARSPARPARRTP